MIFVVLLMLTFKNPKIIFKKPHFYTLFQASQSMFVKWCTRIDDVSADY